MKNLFKVIFLISLVGVVSPSWSYNPNTNDDRKLSHDNPDEIKDVGVVDNTGEKIDLGLTFFNEAGEEVQLAKYFGEKPVLLTMVYFGCPSLCNFHLNGVTATLKEMKSKMGKDYHFVAVSIDPTEKPSLAQSKKDNYLDELGEAANPEGWHFLTTNNEENIKKLAKQVGFKYKWVESTEQYSHAAVAYVMTPEGVISRYMHGIEFSAETLRLSLVEASNGLLGTFVDKFILFCFQFNPGKNKYTLYAYNIMRVFGLIFVLALAVFLVPLWLKEKKKPMIKGEH